MEGKTITKFEILKEVKVVARNYPTEMKPIAIRLVFTDKSYTDIKIDSRGYFGQFTDFLKIT